jgi:hypothetical protein
VRKTACWAQRLEQRFAGGAPDECLQGLQLCPAWVLFVLIDDCTVVAARQGRGSLGTEAAKHLSELEADRAPPSNERRVRKLVDETVVVYLTSSVSYDTVGAAVMEAADCVDGVDTLLRRNELA